jgi:hypothetical protein
MDDSLKEQHDNLLANQPDGANHDTENCPWCNPDLNNPEGGDMSKTYTEDELREAVLAEVGPIKAELDALRADAAEGEVAARIEAMKAEFEEKITELQTNLDNAELAKAAAETARDEIVAWLQAEADAATEAAEIAARRDARLAAVKEAAPQFKDDYIAERAERWTQMDDEAFEALVEGFKEIAAQAPAPVNVTNNTIVPDTALETTRHPESTGSAFRDVLNLTRAGYDMRDVR